MRLPNGYGTCYRLPGNRRRPFVVKKTVDGRQKILGYFDTFEHGSPTFRLSMSRHYWTTILLSVSCSPVGRLLSTTGCPCPVARVTIMHTAIARSCMTCRSAVSVTVICRALLGRHLLDVATTYAVPTYKPPLL